MTREEWRALQSLRPRGRIFISRDGSLPSRTPWKTEKRRARRARKLARFLNREQVPQHRQTARVR